MKYKFKRAVNALRTRVGASPVIITTTAGIDTVTMKGPLLDLIKGSLSGQAGDEKERKELYFVAKSRSGKHTKDGLWDIKAVIKGDFNKCVYDYVRYDVDMPKQPVSFDKMAEFMRKVELRHTRSAGFSGSDEAIIARYRKAVPRSNILRNI